MLAILATASMFYGNLIALVQKDFKRLLGFSGIAHAGYALIGFVALDQFGYTVLVIIAVINAAIAVYYYLCVVREAVFRDPGDRPPIRLDWPTRVLCVLLIAGILALGVAPARVLDTLSNSVANLNTPAPISAAANTTR